MLFLTIIIFFFLLAVLLAWRLHYLIAATTGVNISTEATGSALLVVDLQDGIVSQSSYKNRDELINRIKRTIEKVEPPSEIIFIKHSIKKHPIDTLLTAGQMKIGSPETEIIQELVPYAKIIFEKHRADAFSSIELTTYLQQQKIKHLYLVGADASACIYRTALGGLKRGYNVTILQEGLFATSQKQKVKTLNLYKKQGITII